MTVELTTAWNVVTAVHEEAARRSVLVSAAVVDAGGHLVAFGGGVPIFVDRAVVGGIGVSGASTEDDDACARAGLAALGSGHA